MKKILLLSDNHSFIDEKIIHYAAQADEVWHAGDWGNNTVHETLIKHCKHVRGVYGNIDSQELRTIYPLDCVFTIEEVKVYITHIGGYPGSYAKGIQEKIKLYRPQLYICGHSHILKVMRDPKMNNMLHMNPGAAGIYGFHKIRTWLTFEVDKGNIQNLNVIECNKHINEQA